MLCGQTPDTPAGRRLSYHLPLAISGYARDFITNIALVAHRVVELEKSETYQFN
jgi:hypothetical protein